MSGGTRRCALVLGGYGEIGAAIADALAADGATAVTRSTRAARPDRPDAVVVDPRAGEAGLVGLDALDPLDAVVWAQGVNVDDAADDLDPARHREILDANLLFVTLSLHRLLAAGRVRDGARLCVVSSIWQGLARPGKFSYAVSKAALGGVVVAAAADLAPRGILVNAVLPGVVDTGMTRAVLSPEQVERARAATGFGRLVTLADVAGTVAWLTSAQNTGVTGQSVAVDLGFSVTRAL